MFDLQGYLDREVPLTRAMGIRVEHHGPHGVVLAAPLAPNVNDKGTAFGGSLAALLSLAAWAVTRNVVEATGLDCEIVIVRADLEYLRPARSDFEAHCDTPDAETVAAFQASLRTRGKARWTLPVRSVCEGQTVASQQATFAALRRAQRSQAQRGGLR